MSDIPRRSLIKLPCSDPVYGGNRDMTSWRRLPYRKTFLWFTVALSSALTATGIWLNGEWASYKNPPSVYGKIGLGDSREVVGNRRPEGYDDNAHGWPLADLLLLINRVTTANRKLADSPLIVTPETLCLT